MPNTRDIFFHLARQGRDQGIAYLRQHGTRAIRQQFESYVSAAGIRGLEYVKEYYDSIPIDNPVPHGEQLKQELDVKTAEMAAVIPTPATGTDGGQGAIGDFGNASTGGAIFNLPQTKEIGPGYYPKYYHSNSQTFTVDSAKLKTAAPILVKQGSFINLLCQVFEDKGVLSPDKGPLLIDLTDNLYNLDNAAGLFYQTIVGQGLNSTACNMSYIPWDTLKGVGVFKPTDFEDLSNAATSAWHGHFNNNGRQEGTYGAFPIRLAWTSSKNKFQMITTLEHSEQCKLDAVEFIFSDMQMWDTNVKEANIVRPKTMEDGTILEVPITPIRLERINYNIALIDPDAQKAGMVTSVQRRVVNVPMLDSLVEAENVWPEMQTGWVGGEYRTKLTATKDKWFPSQTSTWPYGIAYSNSDADYFGIAINRKTFNRNGVGRAGLFSLEDFDFNGGKEYTLLDMDQGKEDWGFLKVYTPFTKDLKREGSELESHGGHDSIGSVYGALGMGPMMNSAPYLYLRNKVPLEDIKTSMTYSLQIRCTYTVRGTPYMVPQTTELSGQKDYDGSTAPNPPLTTQGDKDDSPVLGAFRQQSPWHTERDGKTTYPIIVNKATKPPKTAGFRGAAPYPEKRRRIRHVPSTDSETASESGESDNSGSRE